MEHEPMQIAFWCLVCSSDQHSTPCVNSSFGDTLFSCRWGLSIFKEYFSCARMCTCYHGEESCHFHNYEKFWVGSLQWIGGKTVPHVAMPSVPLQILPLQTQSGYKFPLMYLWISLNLTLSQATITSKAIIVALICLPDPLLVPFNAEPKQCFKKPKSECVPVLFKTFQWLISDLN